MRRGLSLFGVLFALLVLLQPSALEAQVGGTISGYVQDQGGGAMPGATVTAELAGQQLVRSTPRTRPASSTSRRSRAAGTWSRSR